MSARLPIPPVGQPFLGSFLDVAILYIYIKSEFSRLSVDEAYHVLEGNP